MNGNNCFDRFEKGCEMRSSLTTLKDCWGGLRTDGGLSLSEVYPQVQADAPLLEDEPAEVDDG